MNLSLRLSVLGVLYFTSSLIAVEAGPLVIVGGGGTPEDVRREFVDMGGGLKAIVAVLPQASNRPDRGLAAVEAFTKLGVSRAYRVDLGDPEKARALINEATVIWFPGGSQARL